MKVAKGVSLLCVASSFTHGHIVSLASSNRTVLESTVSIAVPHGQFLNTSLDGHIAVESDRKHGKPDTKVPDRHGKERALYHLTHYMAQRGRDRILWHFPDFSQKCAHDMDCRLALVGIPDSVTQRVVNQRPAQRGDKFDAVKFLEHASEKGVMAEFDGALWTMILWQGLSDSGPGGLDNLWTTVKQDNKLLTYLRTLIRQTNPGHHKIGHKAVEKAFSKVNKMRPMNGSPMSPQLPSDYNPAGTLFLRSLLSHGVCHGDAYFCDGREEDLSESPTLKLLRIANMDHVLSDQNYFRTALHEISDLPQDKRKGRQWPYLHYNHARKHNKDVQKAIDVAVKETRRAAKSLFMVVAQLRHSFEVFDITTGQLTPATVMPSPKTGEPLSRLRDLGYLRYFTPDVKNNGTNVLTYSRFLRDVTPVLAGAWMLIPADDLGPKLAKISTNYRPSNDSIAAAWWNSGIPDQIDIRSIEALRNDKGDIAVDSMGQPKLRSISWSPALAQMMAVDSVSLRDRGTGEYHVAIRPLKPDGTPFQRVEGYDMSFEFIPGKTAGVNALSIPRQAVKFHRVSHSKRSATRGSKGGLSINQALEEEFYELRTGTYGLTDRSSTLVERSKQKRDPGDGFFDPAAVNAWLEGLEVFQSAPVSPVSSIADSVWSGAGASSLGVGTLGAGASGSTEATIVRGSSFRMGLSPDMARFELFDEAGQAAYLGWEEGSGQLLFYYRGIDGLRAGATVDIAEGTLLLDRIGAVFEGSSAGAEGSAAAEGSAVGAAEGSTSVAGVASGVCFVLTIALSAVMMGLEFAPDHTCPMRARYTEMWNSEVASATTFQAPCESTTTGLYNAFATTASLPTTSWFNGSPDATTSPTGTSWINGSQDATTSPTGTSWISDWVEPISRTTDPATVWSSSHSDAAMSEATSVPPSNFTVPAPGPFPTFSNASIPVGAETNNACPCATKTPNTNTTSTPGPVAKKIEPHCETAPLPQGFQYAWVSNLICPVPMVYECTIDWYRHRVNELPAGRRNPSYCHNGDFAGHYRAEEMGCLPSFEKKGCKKEFGLESLSFKEYLKLRDEI
ncbi:hypothetical protein DOTSEDRAFT_24794 [Dothistroma septosporum NZE10]|uniref:Uncharacterized protein n=1 Tax=Dothistroma septosporum (strain NZE10 / CBS 128990) TaxID=675120 RepID=N1PN34_DOTSN|nr:hypothetical protein DOTSEDRAFT_24794 [Dothistroma septosporum NZE10]